MVGGRVKDDIVLEWTFTRRLVTANRLRVNIFVTIIEVFSGRTSYFHIPYWGLPRASFIPGGLGR